MPTDKLGKVDYSGFTLNGRLDNDLAVFEKIFADDVTFQSRIISSLNTPALKCAVLFMDGMASTKIINEDIIMPVTSAALGNAQITAGMVMQSVIVGNSASETGDVEELCLSILSGDSVVLIDGQTSALKINSRGFAVRSIGEPDDEKSLRGPREGFTESVMMNASMIRRKLQTSDLKFKSKTFGTRSNTTAFICYLDSIVDKKILAELEKRLEKVLMDGVLDVNYIQEHIRDSPRSIFKTCGSTEKPDVVAAKLLEGRIALILDGTPIVMTVPYLFVENLQSADDYYNNFYYGTIGRLLRFVGFLITISAPAIYIALVAFHPEMIPTSLMLSATAAINKVPFPTVFECVLMLCIFEVLRETGIRTPNKIGSALSVVGALVVGQAAVEARIVSVPVVIVVAVTAITGLMIPRLSGAVITTRLLLILAASCLGFYGYFLALVTLFFYMTGLKSFSMDYTSQMFTYNPHQLKDIYVRSPIPDMTTRPIKMSEDIER